jgi:hypothetical protein
MSTTHQGKAASAVGHNIDVLGGILSHCDRSQAQICCSVSWTMFQAAYPFAWRDVPFEKVRNLVDKVVQSPVSLTARKERTSPTPTDCSQTMQTRAWKYLAHIESISCRDALHACFALELASMGRLPSLYQLPLPPKENLEICPPSFTVRTRHNIYLRHDPQTSIEPLIHDPFPDLTNAASFADSTSRTTMTSPMLPSSG